MTRKSELVPMRWGLIPRWGSKTIKEAKMATFNARAETVGTKRSFVTQRLGQNALTFVIRLNATRQRTSM
jgi:putative SOS response-associated peptidase YedK